ncbi:TauD/TfdA family dioxygenase [Streptomyces sp. NPDC088116]|uniref:TauD/TfdA family dioxygenase n=1 Tax=Streptomyces sp. NPDC088116 TaxID=3365825 RepID=UPI003802CE21
MENVRGIQKPHSGLREMTLTGQAALECGTLLDDLSGKFETADDPVFLRQAAHHASNLPAEVLDAVDDLKYSESVAALVIRNGPVGEAELPTPRHWKERDPRATVRQDIWLALTTSRLGDPIAWSSLQDGRLFNDVLPIAGQEHRQTGHSSEADLELHVEDCFSDDRCDALALLCLRNHDKVTNTIVTATDLDFSRLDLDVLFSPRFLIKPDSEHLRRTGGESEVASEASPLLFGSRQSPYLRIDVPYTEALPGDAQAKAELDAFCAQLAERATVLCLAEGDLLLVDNFRALHGRGTFQARYDGTDRWMRKLTVVRDLRRSRRFRSGAEGRVISLFDESTPQPAPSH